MKKLWNQYSYAIILLVLSCSIAIIISIHNNDKDKYLKITVSDGDSLWKISEQFSNQHSLSGNQFISWVKKHNEINGDQIFPGEKIIIPVNKETPSSIEFASAPEK
jgi:hypothetical protein